MTDSTRVLRDARTRDLITIVRTAASKSERSRALEDVTRLHLPLARSLAHRYAGKGIDRDDLEQVAFLALLKAVQRFDLSKPTEFGAYATPTITGELRRHFRDHGWLVRPPRSLQERRQLVTDARSRLEQSLGHEPSRRGDRRGARPHDRGGEGRPGRREQPAPRLARRDDGRRRPPGARPLRRQRPRQLRPGARRGHRRAHRPPAAARSRPRIVELRFTNDLTQAEIAQSMGLSAMQVSRLLRRILDELREHLEPADLRPCRAVPA